MLDKSIDGAEALEEVRSLPDAVRLSIYGKKLYQTTAVKVVEEYYSCLNSPIIEGNHVLGGPLTAKVNLLSAIEIAIEKADTEFFIQFAEALKRRNDQNRRDHWLVVDYVLHKVLRESLGNAAMGKGPKDAPVITSEELEKLFEGKRGKKNISRIVQDLGIKKWIADRRVTGDWTMDKK